MNKAASVAASVAASLSFGVGYILDLLDGLIGRSSELPSRLRSVDEVLLAIAFVVRVVAVRAERLSDMTLKMPGQDCLQPIREKMDRHAN